MNRPGSRVVRWIAGVLVQLGLACGCLAATSAQSRTFGLGGAQVLFEDVTDQVRVRVSAMRWNRNLGVWHAELTVQNLGATAIEGRLLVSAQDPRGTSGPTDADNSPAAPADEPRFWDLSGYVGDLRLDPGEVTRARTVALSRLGNQAPTLTTRVHAESSGTRPLEPLAFTRTLDQDGRPLPGVRVVPLLPAGGTIRESDPGLGAASLGGTPGDYRWRFEREGYLPVWRAARLGEAQVIKLATPRLTLRSGLWIGPGQAGESVEVTNQVRVGVPSVGGGLALRVELTLLDGQALPAPVPLGWSVQRAWWLESTAAWRVPLRVGVRTEDPFPETPASVALVRWDPESFGWRVVQRGAARGAEWIEFEVAEAGAYAVVARDPESSPGSFPEVGAALGAVSTAVTDVSEFEATGRVRPGVVVASTLVADVRARAELQVTHRSRAIPSGTSLRAVIRESYRLADGSVRTPMPYEASLVVRRKPGGAGDAGAVAEFPLQPGLLMDATALEEAHVEVEVLPEGAFAGGVFGGSQGSLNRGGLVISNQTAASGGARAAEVSLLTTASETTGRATGAGIQSLFAGLGLAEPGQGYEAVAAFEIATGSLTRTDRLGVAFDPAPRDGAYVLGRVWYRGVETGLVPVARWSVDQGVMTEDPTDATAGFSGVDRSGQYLLVRVPEAQGRVVGMLRGPSGAAVSNAWMRVTGTPWATLTDARGGFLLAGVQGAGTVVATDPRSGDLVNRPYVMPASGVTEELVLTTENPAPFVLAVEPASGSVDVGLLSSVVVTFSAPMVPPASGSGIELLEAGSRGVPARVEWESDGRVARILASNELAEATVYGLRLASTLTDTRGTRVSEFSGYSFTTVARAVVRSPGAQLTSEAPDANGEVRVLGSAGMGQPRQPILIVNGTTGRTASGFTEPDGSFAQRVEADVGDRLSVVLIHADGTRSSYPVGRQLFPDGSVGLFSEGGRITNRNDDLEVVLDVPAGAVQGRTRFKLTPLERAALPGLTRGTAPENGVLFGGFDFEVEGDPVQGKVRIEVWPHLERTPPPSGRKWEDVTLMATAFQDFPELVEGVEQSVPVYEYLGLLQRGPVTTPARALGTASPRPDLLSIGYYAFVNPSAARVMLVGNVYYSKTELIGQTTSALFDGAGKAIQDSDVPVGGAVIRARALSALNARPFSLQGGELVVTSGADGSFAFLVPEQTAQGPGAGHSLTATHPSFPRQFATSTAGARFDPIHPFGGGKIRFNRKATPDTTPPSITVAHAPPSPPAGGTAIIRVEAVDESGPSTPTLSVESVDPVTAVVTAVATTPGRWEVQSSAPAKVVLRARASDPAGNAGEVAHVLRFGVAPAPPAPVTDPLGPRVLFSQPDANAVGVDTLTEFRLRFSEWVDPDLVDHPSRYVTLSPSAGPVQARFIGDPKEVGLRFPALENGRDYVLDLQALRDLTGQYLDQDPATLAPTNEPFVLKFRTAPSVIGRLPGITEGGGAVARGAFAYVIDRGGLSLHRFDISRPGRPVLLDAKSLPGPPRALVLVPDYQFTLAFADPATPSALPGAVRRSDLLVVAGRTQGAGFGYIRVFDLGLPFSASTSIAGASITMDETALLTRLTWSAPTLLLTENSAAAPQVHVINLQSLLLADAYRDVSRAILDTLPGSYTPGIDANHDGDFVDVGDALPVQGQDTLELVAGEEAVLSLAPNYSSGSGFYQLTSTSRFITDALVDGPASMAVLLTTPGRDELIETTWRPIRTNVLQRPAAVRAFVIGGDSPDTSLPPVVTNGFALEFPGWYPKRALFVPAPLRRLILVSLISLDNATNSLRVLDASRPDHLMELGEIPVPVAEYGLLQGAEFDDRGRIVLSMARGSGVDLLVLDPGALLAPVPASGVHPAILGRIPAAGAGSTPFAALGNGVSVTSLRSINLVSQGAPTIRLLPPGVGTSSALAVVDDRARFEALRILEDPDTLPVVGQGTNAALPATDPAFSWHVLLEAPGGAGTQVEVAVMSLGADGRLASGTNTALGSFQDRVVLRQVSSDPNSPAFNAYVSGPLVLVDESIPDTARQSLRGSHLVLRAGARVRLGIPESMASNPVLGPFAGVGALVANPPPNAPPVRLGVSLARPVSVLEPELTLDSPVIVRTTVDRIQSSACPGSAWIEFRNVPDGKITLLLDGRPLAGVLDESGRAIPVFTNVAFTAGAHRILIDSSHLPQPGDYTLTLIGNEFDGMAPGRTLTVVGQVQHEVEIHHNFPIGHTIIQGVDLWDGHLTFSGSDASVTGRRLSLQFNRSYSSAGDSSEGPLGAGWTHSLHIRLIHKLACGTFTVVGGDGSGNTFHDPRPDPVRAARYLPLLPAGMDPATLEFFTPQIGYHSTLIRSTAVGGELWFFTKEGVRHHFVTSGPLSNSSQSVYALQEIREPNGNALQFAYLDGDTDPATLDTVTEVDPLGGLLKRGLRFDYSMIAGEARIVRLTGFNHQGTRDLLGLEVQYRYDGDGNLTEVTRSGPTPAETRSETFTYTAGSGPAGHNLLSYTGPNGAVLRYQYASATAGASNYYTASGRSLPGTPPHEIVTQVTHVGLARPGFEGTADATFGFRYDAAGGKRYVREPRTADSDGNPIPETEYTLNPYGATVAILGPYRELTEMKWATDHLDGSVLDESGRPVHDVVMTWRRDPEGQEQFFEYHDGRGNLTRERTVFSGSSKRAVTDAAGAAVAEVARVSSYDAVFNQRTNVVDAEGNATVMILDPRTGNLARTVDAEGYTTRFEYFPNGDLRERWDPRNSVTTYLRYDLYGNPELVRDPLGNETVSRYDERSRLLETRDGLTHHVVHTYDALDRRLTEHRRNDLSGLATGPDALTVTTYDPAGLVLTTVSPLGQVTRRFYDARNREVRSVQEDVDPGDGARVNYEMRAGYDVAGNLVSETDARGVTRTHAFDAANRRIRTAVRGSFGGPSNPDGLLTTLAYDRVGNLTNEIDLHGGATRHVHDALYRVVESHLPVPGAVIATRFDREGNIVRKTDAAGQPVTHAYDRIYRVVRTTDAEGRVTEYGYDEGNNRTLIRDLTTGLVSRIAYDRAHREIERSVTGPEIPAAGYVSRYVYLDARNEVIQVDRRGVRTRVRRDGLDRIAESVVDVDTLALTTRYTYDAGGNVLTVVDPQNGDVDQVHVYDRLGRRMRTTWVSTPDDAGDVSEQYVRDPSGKVVLTVDPRGIESRQSYDNLGRPLVTELKETLSHGGSWLALKSVSYDDVQHKVTTRDARGHGSEVAMDGLGRVTRAVNALGHVTRFEFGALNLEAMVDSRGLRTEWRYDRLHRPIQVVEKDAAGTVLTTRAWVHEDAQRRVRMTDPNGIQTLTEADALGRTLRTLRSGPGVAARYGSDPLLLERRDYDPNGNITATEDGDGRNTTFAYDGANRVTNAVAGAGSPVSGATRTVYDRVGNVLETKDARAHGGAFDVRHEYDARYRRVRTTDAMLQTSTFHYDAANRVVRWVEPLGYSTRYSYDELGLLLSVDESDRATPGRVDAGVTRYRYDAARNRIAQQDANTNLVTYVHDPLNRLTNLLQHTAPGALGADARRGLPLGGGSPFSWGYAFDAKGHVTNALDPRGQIAEFEFDALGRLTTRRFLGHAEKAAAGHPLDFQPITLRYTYDAAGNLLETVEDKQFGAAVVSERTEMTYDVLNRLATRTRFDRDDAAGRTLAFTYDIAGNRTNLVDTDGRVTRYTFDARNRLQTVVMDALSPAPLTATYSWSPDDLLSSVALPGGSVSLRAYDPADRLVSLTNASPAGAPFSIFSYTYDAHGNRILQTESQPALGVAGDTTQYAYDALNRLKEVRYGGAGAITNTYAPNGSRLTEVGVDPVAGAPIDRVYHYGKLATRPAATFDGVNALTRIEDRLDPARTIEFEYDANLNQVARIQGVDRHEFRFDVRDQMIAALTGGATTRFDYNADRLRSKKVASTGDETRYLYDQSAVLIEYAGASKSHQTLHKYEYGRDLLGFGVASAGGGMSRQFYLHDGLGSALHLVDGAGTLGTSYRYDVWGRVRASLGPRDNPREFTGHYRDPETGLMYFGARYYDDEQARFLSQDPNHGQADTPPSLHRFLYAHSNPLRFTDPTGFAAETSEAADQWLAEAKKELADINARFEADIASQGPDAMAKYQAGPAAEAELQRLDEEHRRMLQENGLTDADLKNPVMADRARWGLALLQRDLVKWSTEGDGGTWRAVVAGTVHFGAQMLLSPFELGAGAGTVAGKLDVGAEVTTGEWIAAAGDVVSVAGAVGQIGKMGVSSLGRRAAEQASAQVARGAVVQEARRSIGAAVADAAKVLDDIPKRVAAEKEWLQISRQIDDSMRALSAERKAGSTLASAAGSGDDLANALRQGAGIGSGADDAARTAVTVVDDTTRVLRPGDVLSPEVLRNSGRDFLPAVYTEDGIRSFYRSTGHNSGQEHKWFPADGFDYQVAPVAEWVNKIRYMDNKVTDPLHRFGTQHFKDVAMRLDDMGIPRGRRASQREINQALYDYGVRSTPEPQDVYREVEAIERRRLEP